MVWYGDCVKFKSKEELIENSAKKIKNTERLIDYTNGVCDTFQSFAERIKVYDECKDNPMKLMDNYKDIFYELFPKQGLTVFIFEYNKKLFDYCFGDVK